MKTKEEAKKQLLELFDKFNVVAGNNKVRIPLSLHFPNGEVKSIRVTKIDGNIYISREYIGEVPSLTFEEILEYCRIIREKIGM
jgi:hypothetical protein